MKHCCPLMVINCLYWKGFFTMINGHRAQPPYGSAAFLGISGRKVVILVAYFFIPKHHPVWKNTHLQDGPPTSYKWSYNPCKWPYKWVTPAISPISGVVTVLITGRGPTCCIARSAISDHEIKPRNLTVSPTKHYYHPQKFSCDRQVVSHVELSENYTA